MKYSTPFVLLLAALSLTLASPTTTPEPDSDDTTTSLPDIEPTTLPASEEAAETPAAPEIKDRNADAMKYPGFSRDCTNSNDCQYRNKLVKSTAYLNCANRVCICENNRYIADVSVWKLEWNGTSCAIAVSGPCGTDASGGGELAMHCQTGLKCVEGRCRDPAKLRQTPLNHSCHESIDCLEGLVCKVTAFYFGPSSTCVAPDTPALKGFEEAGTTTAPTTGAADPDSSSLTTTGTSTSTTSAATTTTTPDDTTKEADKMKE